jgi:hypothetical protein
MVKGSPGSATTVKRPLRGGSGTPSTSRSRDGSAATRVTNILAADVKYDENDPVGYHTGRELETSVSFLAAA